MLTLGRHSFITENDYVCWFNDAVVRIGNYTCIARGTVFLGGQGSLHACAGDPALVSVYPFERAFRGADYPPGLTPPPTDVGSDVWVGTQAMLLPGVRVGHGAIVGARTVVSKDVPPFARVVGAPMRVVGYRFPPEVVAALLRIGWWDWPDDRVRAAVPLMRDIGPFVAAFDPAARPPTAEGA